MEQVLTLLGFEPLRRSGAQWSGVCPLHGSASGRGRSFSVNVAIGRYHCHGCRSHGNHLELWAAANNLPLHQAAIDLCQRLGREVPWIRRW
jgi:DNA primase